MSIGKNEIDNVQLPSLSGGNRISLCSSTDGLDDFSLWKDRVGDGVGEEEKDEEEEDEEEWPSEGCSIGEFDFLFLFCEAVGFHLPKWAISEA